MSPTAGVQAAAGPAACQIRSRFLCTNNRPYDLGAAQVLKKETGDWVSRYAKGGSARRRSARQFYVAVDALQVGLLDSQAAACQALHAE